MSVAIAVAALSLVFTFKYAGGQLKIRNVVYDEAPSPRRTPSCAAVNSRGSSLGD